MSVIRISVAILTIVRVHTSFSSQTKYNVTEIDETVVVDTQLAWLVLIATLKYFCIKHGD